MHRFARQPAAHRLRRRACIDSLEIRPGPRRRRRHGPKEREAIRQNALELAVSDFGIQKVDTSGVDLDQYVILPQLRIWHVTSPHAIGASVTIEDECLHGCCLSTTFPRPSMKTRLHRRSACEA